MGSGDDSEFVEGQGGQEPGGLGSLLNLRDVGCASDLATTWGPGFGTRVPCFFRFYILIHTNWFGAVAQWQSVSGEVKQKGMGLRYSFLFHLSILKVKGSNPFGPIRVLPA
jgi:hypothetical protein